MTGFSIRTRNLSSQEWTQRNHTKSKSRDSDSHKSRRSLQNLTSPADTSSLGSWVQRNLLACLFKSPPWYFASGSSACRLTILIHIRQRHSVRAAVSKGICLSPTDDYLIAISKCRFETVVSFAFRYFRKIGTILVNSQKISVTVRNLKKQLLRV